MENTHPAHKERSLSPIIELRLKIDRCINSTKLLKGSREISLAHTNLQRAFSWLGMALGAAGETSPYKESFNPASKLIEPTAEHTEDTLLSRWTPTLMDSQLACIKDFRSFLAVVNGELKAFIASTESAGSSYDLYLISCRLALEEASIWLGWELAEIKKKGDCPLPAIKP